MTNDRDVIRAVEAWLDEGLPSLPDRVVDAALAEASITRQRRGNWLERRLPTQDGMLRFGLATAAVVVVVLVGANLLAGVGPGGPGGPAVSSTTASASASASPRMTASPRGPVGGPVDTLYGLDISAGFIGLPPLGAASSEPAQGVLIDEWRVRCCLLPYRGMARLYADGRLIWNMYYGPQNAYSTGYLEERFTPTGLALLTAESDERKKDPARLREWLPASAWADPEIRAYVPRSYEACVLPYSPQSTVAPRADVLELLPADARELLLAADRFEDEIYGGSDCWILATPDARLLDAYLRAADIDQDAFSNRYLLQYQKAASPGGESGVSIIFEPVFPDGSVGCSGCG